MEFDISELLEQRQMLFLKLLECSRKQLVYLGEVEQDAENDLTLFLEIQSSWNDCIREISALDQLLQSADTSIETNDQRLIEILHEIDKNIDTTIKNMKINTQQAGISLRDVNNQRKVLNAYYGLQRNDQVPLYLDEKK
ncbi:hypothetical protein SAMN02744102_02316 [Paenibacillus barengoltzii]|uniref:hypothetical protein n=1 Tax=Paenibacillus barengoltzii TaxID=343517 RepID=UPI000A082864|nr:hypothetical protein [Paenibacillus barengoltzii]SMF26982.1 hypothetical protein SAMN02744102_02316 [Paenibacillus barengoltzii]